jgi:hypothetical protein
VWRTWDPVEHIAMTALNLNHAKLSSDWVAPTGRFIQILADCSKASSKEDNSTLI